jgi:hypothetical protein
MSTSFRALVEQYKDENRVLSILKAAELVDSKDTVDKVRDREFSEGAIQNGFNVILDYFKSSIVPQDDYKKANELFRKHQSDKGKVGKQAVVADAKSQAAPAQATGAITAKDVRPLSALVGKDGVIISEIPIDGETADLWVDYRDKKAADLADSISEAPFRAIDQAADEVDPDKVGLGWRGSLFGKLNEELNDPRRVQYLREKYFGKKPQK